VRLDGDVVEALPAGGPAQLGGERLRDLAGVLARLQPGREHPQDSAGPVALEVDPGGEVLAVQERQDVVAVHPLRRRDVDLDAVVEAEQPASPGPLPHQRVER